MPPECGGGRCDGLAARKSCTRSGRSTAGSLSHALERQCRGADLRNRGRAPVTAGPRSASSRASGFCARISLSRLFITSRSGCCRWCPGPCGRAWKPPAGVTSPIDSPIDSTVNCRAFAAGATGRGGARPDHRLYRGHGLFVDPWPPSGAPAGTSLWRHRCLPTSVPARRVRPCWMDGTMTTGLHPSTVPAGLRPDAPGQHRRLDSGRAGGCWPVSAMKGRNSWRRAGSGGYRNRSVPAALLRPRLDRLTYRALRARGRTGPAG